MKIIQVMKFVATPLLGLIVMKIQEGIFSSSYENVNRF